MDRRKGIDRRYNQVEVALERRKSIDRRSGHDRRTNPFEVEINRRA